MNAAIQGFFWCFIWVNILAASAIGIQFYNKCEDLHDDEKMKRNKHYLIGVLVVATLVVFSMLVVVFMGTKQQAGRALNNARFGGGYY